MNKLELKELVDRFLVWPLPKSVCSDLCVTDSKYPHQRVGTNLLTADEARQMLEYLFVDSLITDLKEEKMKKFEYRILNFSDAKDGKWLNLLNALGREGWEITNKITSTSYLLKRELE